MVTWRTWVYAILTAVIGALGIVGIFYTNYQERRIEELVEINKRLLAESEALKEFSKKMTTESEEYVAKVKTSEQVLKEESSWADCSVPVSVSQCVCDSGKSDSGATNGTMPLIEDLK